MGPAIVKYLVKIISFILVSPDRHAGLRQGRLILRLELMELMYKKKPRFLGGGVEEGNQSSLRTPGTG
jgi:hypothetical protein